MSATFEHITRSALAALALSYPACDGTIAAHTGLPYVWAWASMAASFYATPIKSQFTCWASIEAMFADTPQ